MKFKFSNSCKLLVVVLSVFLSISLLGCGGSKDKKKDMPYLKSTSGTKLKIPDDLNTPKQNALFEIPSLPEGSTSTQLDPGTLEKPPALFEEAKSAEED